MTISIDWPARVINVPRADMTLIQSSPIEVRELELNAFRLTLKNLEDDEAGITFLHTHIHNPPVSVGGVTLARVVEIINDYTVTFEDAAYVVNLVGANSNIADRVNPNNVSIRSANSAGLMQSVHLESLALIQGLVAGTPLVVSPTSRVAGSVTQSISESGGVVTVART